jgi:hypothetical protein
MDPKKTQAGQKFAFSASLYNDLIDVVKWAKTQRGLNGSGQNKMRSNATNVGVKNNVGSQSDSTPDSLPAFSVVEINNRVGVETDFIWLKTLEGVTPTGCSLPVAITQAPSLQGEMVECVIAGATIARVRVDSLGDRFASPVAGETFLASNFDGGMFRILEPLTSTGVQRLLVAYHFGVTQICDTGSSSSSGSDSSESLCLSIPGVDMDLIPLVDAATVDYVLAIKDGCLVKVAVSDCGGSV